MPTNLEIQSPSHMTRRKAIQTTALATAAAAMIPHVIAQTAAAAPSGPFTLPPLPYAFDALEPHLDARTMEIHHDRHHKGYVDNLNKAVATQETLKSKTIEQILQDLGAGGGTIGKGMTPEMANVAPEIRAAIRNHGGGHHNHSLFWQMMSKSGGGEPKGEIAQAIEANFGSFRGFKEGFSKAGLGQFGSGWAWLVVSQGKLAIEASANQDSPLSSGKQPLLGVDVWEHAYYLKYQNKRADYIAAWWNVVNWDFVADRYAKLKG